MNAEIGKRMHDRRKELNMSALEIASKTGLSKATIHRYESGDIKKIKLPVIESISEILNVNPAWLIGKSKIKEHAAKDNDISNLLNEIAIKLRKGATYKGIAVNQPRTKILLNIVETYLNVLESEFDNN